MLNLNLNISNVLLFCLSITRSQGISSKCCNLRWWSPCCVAIVRFLVILDKGIVKAKIHACEYHDRPSMHAWLQPKLIFEFCIPSSRFCCSFRALWHQWIEFWCLQLNLDSYLRIPSLSIPLWWRHIMRNTQNTIFNSYLMVIYLPQIILMLHACNVIIYINLQ
jgi:hypothetical protein